MDPSGLTTTCTMTTGQQAVARTSSSSRAGTDRRQSNDDLSPIYASRIHTYDRAGAPSLEPQSCGEDRGVLGHSRSTSGGNMQGLSQRPLLRRLALPGVFVLSSLALSAFAADNSVTEKASPRSCRERPAVRTTIRKRRCKARCRRPCARPDSRASTATCSWSDKPRATARTGRRPSSRTARATSAPTTARRSARRIATHLGVPVIDVTNAASPDADGVSDDDLDAGSVGVAQGQRSPRNCSPPTTATTAAADPKSTSTTFRGDCRYPATAVVDRGRQGGRKHRRFLQRSSATKAAGRPTA